MDEIGANVADAGTASAEVPGSPSTLITTVITNEAANPLLARVVLKMAASRSWLRLSDYEAALSDVPQMGDVALGHRDYVIRCTLARWSNGASWGVRGLQDSPLPAQT